MKQFSLYGGILLVCLLACDTLPAAHAQQAEADPAGTAAEGTTGPVDPAVDSGRRALDGWNRYPWYDRTTDDLTPIDFRVPRQRSASSATSSLGQLDLAPLQYVLWLLAAVALVGLAWMLVRAFLDRDQTETEASDSVAADTDDHARIEALPVPVQANGGNLLEAARRARAAGDYRQAIIYLYSHQLVELDRHQWIRLAKGKTNRQYLRELTGQPLARLLDDTMLLFEDVYFGGRQLAADRFESCWSRLDEFDNLVGRSLAA